MHPPAQPRHVNPLRLIVECLHRDLRSHHQDGGLPMTESSGRGNMQIPDGWSLARDGSAIQRSFEFATFLDAIGFMNRVVPVCEQLNHHPDWTNVYRRVDVVLTTHHKGAITDLDLTLADEMNRLAGDDAA